MATRRERVILTLQDDLSGGMAKAAVSTRMLGRELDGLSGRSVAAGRATGTASRDIDRLSASAVRGTQSIDQFSGRLGIMLRLAATLGPALAPIGAVGIAGVAGLASQLGFASAGALSLVVAFQGVGDALEAVNEAALEPTAENLAKAQEAMAKIGPEAQAFVSRFQELRPVLADLRDSAAAGWFPGLTDSLDSLESAAPRIESLLFAVSKAGGDAIAAGAESLAGPRWAEFISFIEAEAPDAITALSQTVGSLTHGLAELWMAFDPANDGVRDWLVDAAAGFDEWASGLAETEGFKEFIEYLNTNGPKVADAAAAIGNALLQIVQAAAPLGGPVLDALTGIANAIAVIADSPLGTPIMAGVAAMSALSLATNVATAALGRFKVAQAAMGVGGAKGKGAGPMALAGGPAGAALLAGYIGVSNQVTNFQDTMSDKQSPWEGLLRGAVPAFNTLEMIGIKLPGLTNETDALAGSTGDLVDMVLGLGDATDETAGSTERLTAALAQHTSVTLGAFSAETQYREALKAAKEQADTNAAGLKGNSEEVLNNRRALESLAGAWQQQRDEMAQTEEGTKRIPGALRNARAEFISVAEAMGVSKRRAKELADALIGIPKNTNVKVNADTASAKAALRDFRAELAAIKSKNVTVSTTFRRFFSGPAKAPKSNTAPLPPGIYDYSSGGFTGSGGKYEPAGIVHRGEVVLPQSVVSRDASYLRTRYGHLPGMADLPGYADGGRVGKRTDYFGSNGVVMLPNGMSAELSLFAGGLKSLNKALDRSEAALDDETQARDAVLDRMSSVSSAASGLATSSLFGETQSWSAGGSLQDAIGTLTGDIATGSMLSASIGQLTALGLDGDAMAALLESADAQTIGQIAASATVEQVAQYEALYATRASMAAQVGGLAGAAAYGASLAPLEAQVAQTNAELAQIKAAIKSADKSNTGGQAKAADSTKRGKGKAVRSVKKGARVGS